MESKEKYGDMDYISRLKSGAINDKYNMGYPYMLPTSAHMHQLYTNLRVDN